MEYRIEQIVDVKALVGEGPVWDDSRQVLYWTDIRTGRFFRYDPATGDHQTIHQGVFVGGLGVNRRGGLTLGTRRTFVKLGLEEGIPDGITVDAEGFVWSAIWGGGCVIRFDPDGTEERRIRFPATQTSACAFGGADLTDLYVSTASWGTGGPPSGLEPIGYDFSAHRGGELYRVRLDIQGKPEFQTDFAWPS